MDGPKPSLETTNNCLRLECWGIVPNGDVYTAPEARTFSLKGFVFNHQRFEDGHGITTSAIVEITGRLGDPTQVSLAGAKYTTEVIVKTASGSEYLLGEPDIKYEEMFPNAKERLLKNGLKSR